MKMIRFFFFNSIFAYTWIQVMTLHQVICVSPFSLLVKNISSHLGSSVYHKSFWLCRFLWHSDQFFFFPLQYLMTFFREFLSIISSCMNFYFCSTYPLDLNSLLSLLHHVISLLRTHHSLPIAFKIKSKFLPQPTKATHDLAFLSFAITYTLFYMTQTSCTHLLKWPSLDLCVWVLLVFLTFSER